MTTTTVDLDTEVKNYLDLTERIEQLTAEREEIKARLRAVGVGKHDTSFGVAVSVSANRRFNVDRAWTTLTPEQQSVCLAPDARKVRGQLAPALVEAFMEDAGEPRVTVK